MNRRPVLRDLGDGRYRAEWPTTTVRYLLDDGRTVDVETPRDDSDLRGALLELTRAGKIAGAVELHEQGTLS
jgi:hypothetical protein